ncbi:MAG: hypothetical protein LBD02_07505 [Christensenellaceae bacterium]|jgi:hypothetical protein|nr:hypothetical protein [Christensenellaceae bacterium]
MAEDKKAITLPKTMQLAMMKFFLKTSIPRKKREQGILNQAAFLAERFQDENSPFATELQQESPNTTKKDGDL